MTTSPTTDFVIESLDTVFAEHGVPHAVHSDHGTQWYAVNGGDCRFDAKCEEWGTKHTMAPIRTPEGNGKAERVHGSMRGEAGLPESATLDGYRSLMEEYVRHYNEDRPHCALEYRTPKDVFDKTSDLDDKIQNIPLMIWEALEQ